MVKEKISKKVSSEKDMLDKVSEIYETYFDLIDWLAYSR